MSYPQDSDYVGVRFLDQASDLDTPSANRIKIYSKSGELYKRNSAGTVVQFAMSAGGMADAAILEPGSSTRNVIKPSGDFISMVFKGSVGQTQPLTVWRNSADAQQASMSASGALALGPLGPSAKLDVNASGSSSGDLRGDIRSVSASGDTRAIFFVGVGSNADQNSNPNFNITVYSDTHSTLAGLVRFMTFSAVTELRFGNTPNAPITFYVNNAEQARLTATGFGIGVTPTAALHVKASVAGASQLRLAPGVAPTAPNDGDAWHDSTQKSLIVYLDGIKQIGSTLIFAPTADVTFSNTAAAQSLLSGTGIGTKTLPANFFVVGKQIRIKICGYHSTAGAAPTVNIIASLGGTTVCQTTAVTHTASLTDRYFEIEIIITCRTTGTTGTVRAEGRAVYQTNVATTVIAGMVSTSTTTINTTTTQAIDVTWTFGTADASNAVTVTNATIEVLD